MRTFGTLAPPGSFVGDAPGTVLMGRPVANSEQMKALFRHGSFERYLFFVGEARDVETLEALFVAPGHIARERLEIRNLLDLPAALAEGAMDVLHVSTLAASFHDLVWLRDRHARRTLPVTAQIHSLSYPRGMMSYLRGCLHPPSTSDAIFCSSQAGRSAVEAAFASAADSLARVGARVPPLGCALPVVPLGMDLARMTSGDRARGRQRLRLPSDAPVLLGLARFTEYDKMDLFPLLQAFRATSDRIARFGAGGPPPVLVLAGARQGTKTPEMVTLWARMLGIADRVVLDVDFPEEHKPDLLAAADLFVSPSDNMQETFGLSVVEAMAAGLPVIASDFDGYKDTVSPDVGVRVPARLATSLDHVSALGPLLYERPLHLLLGQAVEIDLPALEEAMALLVLDAPLRARLGAAARARVARLYDWPRVIESYEQVWRALAAQPFAPRPTEATPPVSMDFETIFAAFPSGRVSPDRMVVRTPIAEALCGARNQYLIYPELRTVFTDEDVLALLALAARPITLTDLAAADAAARPAFAGWRRSHALAWLLKHGLLG